MMIMAEELERIYVIPLRGAKRAPRWKRSPKAMREIRSFVSHHMKIPEGSVWIDDTVNETVWKRGAENPPSKIRVKVIKFMEEDEEEYVEVTLPEE